MISVFWLDTDEIVKDIDASRGALGAAENIGKKYLDPLVYRAIRNEKYKSILRKIGVSFIVRFRKKDIMAKLSREEQWVFDNFLRKIREQGVYHDGSGCRKRSYKFENEIYPVYFMMESMHTHH